LEGQLVLQSMEPITTSESAP